MVRVYFDSGTSNTRAYLLHNFEVVSTVKMNIGSKDSSIAKSNVVLLKGLKELYDRLLDEGGIEDGQVSGIYASGMVTSPYGIKEVPHLSTPLSLEKLYKGIYAYYEPQFLKREIRLIRGAKTISEGFCTDICNIHHVNNMRGEEIEVFGVLQELDEDWRNSDIAIFLPGSHTNIGYVKEGVLYDILSTFSGELYHAIATGTILSSAIRSDADRPDKEMVLLGAANLKEYGINRALYIGHAMKIFDVADNPSRKSYLEGVINAGVTEAFLRNLESKWKDVKRVVIAGDSNVSEIYRLIMEEERPRLEVMILKTDANQNHAVKGFVEMLKRGE